MWTPVLLSPALAAAGVAGVFSERAARTGLPARASIYFLAPIARAYFHTRGVVSARAARTVRPGMASISSLDGIAGTYFHLRGVARKPGGFREATYNLVMGPPALAPGSLAMVGGMGLPAAPPRPGSSGTPPSRGRATP